MKIETFSRRDFLKTSGALVVDVFARPTAGGRRGGRGGARQDRGVDQVDGFLAIDAKGRVTVYSGKVDLGTGIRTAMTQIAAEELSVPLDRVTVIEGDTALTPDQGNTWGSLSIQIGGMQIRQAAATAREALLAEGAAKLGVPRGDVIVKDGVVAAQGRRQGCRLRAACRRQEFRDQGRREGAAQGARGATRSSANRCSASTFPTR